jgi:hypothetical protein
MNNKSKLKFIKMTGYDDTCLKCKLLYGVWYIIKQRKEWLLLFENYKKDSVCNRIFETKEKAIQYVNHIDNIRNVFIRSIL